VISTSPAPFTRGREGSTVTLVVSTGKQPLAVPTVRGKQVADATAVLEGAGFQVAIVKQVSQQPPGTVLDQSPGPNARAPKGSTVTLTVAKMSNKVDVPNVVGQNENDAISSLAALGFGARTRNQTVTSQAQDGVVLSQTPPAGTKLRRGGVVSLVIARFQATTTPAGPTGPAPPGH
jgi:serine/threonine-protein kinase